MPFPRAPECVKCSVIAFWPCPRTHSWEGAGQGQGPPTVRCHLAEQEGQQVLGGAKGF